MHITDLAAAQHLYPVLVMLFLIAVSMVLMVIMRRLGHFVPALPLVKLIGRLPSWVAIGIAALLTVLAMGTIETPAPSQTMLLTGCSATMKKIEHGALDFATAACLAENALLDDATITTVCHLENLGKDDVARLIDQHRTAAKKNAIALAKAGVCISGDAGISCTCGHASGDAGK